MQTTKTPNEVNTSQVKLQEHQSYSYVPRTGENAHGADITVAFAVDFTTAGECLTARLAGARIIQIPYGIPVVQAAAKLIDFFRIRSGKTLNIAGNGIYSLAEKGVKQSQVNSWVHDVLSLVLAEIKITSIRSGGQTGIDQAGLVAGIALGIPVFGLYPKNFRRRNAQGKEITSTPKAIEAELLTQAALLAVENRPYHPDGTLPQHGEIFVFGSNLAGRHGKGSALVAEQQFGAQYGVGSGRTGQSYAIPTKYGLPGTPPLHHHGATRTLGEIEADVAEFIAYARNNKEEKFFIVRLGCALAAHQDTDIAPMFARAPLNCNLPEIWRSIIQAHLQKAIPDEEPMQLKPGINIASNEVGLGGGLTNMTERAREKGKIKHAYPVRINEVSYPDSEAAYQALKIPGNDAYNDALMIDVICAKFHQHKKLFDIVAQNGGAAWLATCSHFTGAKSERFQAWEGAGLESRFIRDLVAGYTKAVTGRGPGIHVVHVKEAPYDIYIGRANGSLEESIWHSPYVIGEDGDREEVVSLFHDYLQKKPALLSKLGALQGKTLGCWCKSRKEHSTLCHGDVLVAIAQGQKWEAPLPAQGGLF